MSDRDYANDPSPYAKLLDKVCVGHGYCGSVRHGIPLHVNELIPSDGRLTADQFACLVLIADGTNPFDEDTYGNVHRKTIAGFFVECFGRDWAHVSELRYSSVDLNFSDENKEQSP